MNGTIMGATVSAALSDRNLFRSNYAALLIVKSKCMSSYGNIIPRFPFSMTPWSRSFLTSECTALTSRPTLRATSRIDNSPTPVMAWMIAIRLGESVSCSKSQLTKDRNCPCADSSPFQTAINRSLVSSMLETLMFSVVMKLFSVSFYVSPEVSQQLPDVSQRNTNFCLANMLVIPFSGFVVVAQYTCVIDDVSETVFVAMLAASDRRGNLPDHQFCTSMLRNANIFPHQQLGWHLAFTFRVFNVVNNSNVPLVLSMKSSLDSMNSGRYTELAAANTVAGIGVPESNSANNRACGFFMRKELPRRHIMVRRVGASQDAPGSELTGYAKPARLATLEIGVSGGELYELNSEAATMATTLTQKRLGDTRAYHSNLNLAHHAAMTSALLECASFLHGNACREAKRHQLDLLLIAEERMDELTDLLQQGARSESEYSPSYSKSLHEKREI